MNAFACLALSAFVLLGGFVLAYPICSCDGHFAMGTLLLEDETLDEENLVSGKMII